MKGNPLGKDDVKTMGSIYVHSDEMSRFDFGSDHPFKPERASKTYDLCTRYGVMNYPWMKILDPEPIDQALLTLFHEPSYLSLLKDASSGQMRPEMLVEMLERGIGTEDTPILSGIYEWSLRAAGGTHVALQKIISGDALIAFNPLAGFHHALPDHAEGFCYINDIVIALKDVLRG